MIAAKGIDLDMFYAAPTLGRNVLAHGVRDAMLRALACGALVFDVPGAVRSSREVQARRALRNG